MVACSGMLFGALSSGPDAMVLCLYLNGGTLSGDCSWDMVGRNVRGLGEPKAKVSVL